MIDTRIIDGRARAAALADEVAAGVAAHAAATGTRPGLAIVRVGDDPASAVYVAAKLRASARAGLHAAEHHLPAHVAERDVLETVRVLNAEAAIHAVLVQLPLPAGIDAARVLAAVDPAKDVDGFHPLNVGRLASGLVGRVPCTPRACLELLRGELASLDGLHAVVLGRSAIVGRPMAAVLLRENCTVTVAHSRTRDLPSVCRAADILVVAVGRPHLVGRDWIRPGAVVLDVGINRIRGDDGRSHLVGDVATAEAMGVARAITPVPGGVGPMTVACLLRGTLEAAREAACSP